LRQEAELLKGAMDFHVHAGPSLFPRLMDSVEMAKSAKAASMAGLVIKHHHTPTVDRAYLTSKMVRGVKVFGGVTLNYNVGGLNPFAVDAALRLGGKIVWMPSADAMNHKKVFGDLGKYDSRLDYDRPDVYGEVSGITLFDNRGNLDERVGKILDLVAEADAVVATSHLDVKESKALIEEARRRGVRKMLVTHVKFVTPQLTAREQKWMKARGAMLELCYCSLTPAWKSTSIDEVVDDIREIGAEHYVLASDLGQVGNPLPSEGMRTYVKLLLERGVTPREISVMVKENPEHLLGLREDS
jgi:hypothetical protein